MTKIKTFKYYGQKINYYNKVKNNPAVKEVCCGISAEYGYHVEYSYK